MLRQVVKQRSRLYKLLLFANCKIDVVALWVLPLMHMGMEALSIFFFFFFFFILLSLSCRMLHKSAAWNLIYSSRFIDRIGVSPRHRAGKSMG